MATPEFEQTGSTSGQRLFATEQTKPRNQGSRFGEATDRFVSRVIAESPDTLARLRSPDETSSTPARLFGDLSDDELRNVVTQVAAGAELDQLSAADLSRFLSSG